MAYPLPNDLFDMEKELQKIGFKPGQRITFSGQFLTIRTQWHKWWNFLEMRILQLIYDTMLVWEAIFILILFCAST